MKTALKTQIQKMIDMHMRNILEKTMVTNHVVKSFQAEGKSTMEISRILSDHIQHNSRGVPELTDEHVQNKMLTIAN